MRLLLVEDNVRLRELVADALTHAGYRLDSVATVADLPSCVADVKYDLIIINLDRPDRDCLEAIRSLRVGGCTTPILITTASDSIDDCVSGLDAGADDYLIKPRDKAELLARVRALLRRPSNLQGPVLRIGNTELDEVSAEVRSAGKHIYLRRSERQLLALLMRRSGRVVPRSTIEERLSEFNHELSGNALEAQVSRTRKKLSEAKSDIVIETMRGVGYRLKEDGTL